MGKHQFMEDKDVLRALVEAAVMGIVVVDTEGIIVMINPYGWKLFGYDKGELIGQSLDVLIPPPVLDAHTQYQQTFFADPKARPMGIGRPLHGLRKSGERFPLEVSLSHMQLDKQRYAIAFVIDVTRQQEIKDQNIILSRVFHESLNSIFLMEAETFRFTQANMGALEQAGYSLEELRQLHPWKLEKGLTEASFRQRIAPLQKQKNRKITFETIFLRKDQTTLPVEVHLQQFVYDSREVYMQMVIDIRERKQAEEALSLQSEITRNLAEGVLLIRASDAHILYTNAQADSMFGYQKEELYEQHIRVLIAPMTKSSREVFQDIEHALQETGNWSGEVCNRRKDGTSFWCWASVSTFEHPTYGKVWVSMHTNIDQRKKVEAALEHEKEKAQRYLDVAAAVFIVVENDRTISLVNQKCCELLGYAEDEIIGLDWFTHFIPEYERDRVLSVFNQTMQGDLTDYEYFENRVQTRHQGERLMEWHNAIIRDTLGQPVATLSSGIDITEKRKVEQARMQALIEGQELERKRIAKELHDGLGQSLTAIRLHLNALESDATQFTRNNQAAFEKLKAILQTTSQEVKAISRDLMPHILQDYGLAKALEFLCQTINETNAVKLYFQVYNMERELDQATTIGLYRVAQELINNALKHSQANRIDVQLVGHDSSIVLSVEDDGVGFDTKKKDPAKQSFGLRNIETRVKSLSGSLDVETRPGEGTLVIVEIPLNQAIYVNH